MKRFVIQLMIIIVLSAALISNCFAALDADTVWEVRTTGADTSGGGFNASNASVGTDFSQQDAAQDSGTDLASADGDAVPCIVTSATHNFVAADNGNIIQITEAGDGFTLGFYEIVSTATNAATLDRACGSDGAKTGGDWAYGGALAHPAKAATGVVAGNTTHVKAGTYQKFGANDYVMTISTSGGNGIPITWDAYNSTRGDDPVGANRPVLDGDSGGANSVTDTLVTTNINGNIFKNFIIQKGASLNIDSNADFNLYYNTRITNSSGFGIGVDKSSYIFCEIDNNTDGVNNQNSEARLYYSYIHDNSGDGANSTNGYSVHSIYDTNGAEGFFMSRVLVIEGNIFYNNTSDGISTNFNGTGVHGILSNNIFDSNGDYGFNRTTTARAIPYHDYNLFYNNTTAAYNNLTAGENDVTTDPLFTNAASGDFTLSASSSGATNAGLVVSTDVGVTGSYNMNIGIDQDDNAAGGGATSYIFIQ